MKIFFIVSRFPYPLVKGDKLRAFHQIKELSETCDIFLCALTDEKVSDASIIALRPYCKEIHVFHLNFFTIALNVLRYFFFTKRPIQTGYFYNSAILKKINHLIDQSKPDHIICQLIRTVSYVKHIDDIPKTLDYMDALSAGMARRAEHAKGIKKRVFSLEANRLRKFEHDVLKYFDNALAISYSDRKLIFHYDNEAIEVVPNGIDLHYFTPEIAQKDFNLLFTGNMSYPPNVQSALYLVDEIMPIVWKNKPETKLLISGANPTQKIKSLASKKVVVKGWIKDIRTSYARSSIFVAPMLIGSGLQNKLLEAMAMKMPCISSELANKALGAVEGESILIGRNANEYAHHILSLLEKPDKASEMAEKGHRFVAGQFSWSKSNEILLEIIRNGRT